MVFKALHIHPGGGHLGQLLVFHGAACHGHGLARQVGKALDVQALAGKHRLKERGVSGGEVDHLLALGVLAQGRDHEVGLLRLQVRNAVGAGHGDQLDLHAQLGANVVGHFHVQALGLEVGAHKAVGRVVGGDGDLDLFGFEDVVQRALGVRGRCHQGCRHARCSQHSQRHAAGAVAVHSSGNGRGTGTHQSGHSKAPR